MCLLLVVMCAVQVPFAHDVAPADDLLTAVQQIRPSILMGVSTVAGAFTQEVVEAMAAINTRPLIFPVSNPTSKSECTFEQAASCNCWAGGERILCAAICCTSDPTQTVK
jgi:malate dehydrogenase (oxaloacetate-decarboxylating)(NADP+)